MRKQEMLALLANSEEFFERSTRCLTEAESNFSPADGLFTAAQQMAHAAQTIEWFVEGANSEFDLDFATHEREVREVKSVSTARQWLAKAFNTARSFVDEHSEEELNQPLPPGPVMGGAPKSAVFAAISEHTAHHRGALTIYSRLAGKTPLMPYGE